MDNDEVMIRVLVRVHRDGGVSFNMVANTEEVPDRIGRLLASSALDAAKHAIQEDGLRRAQEEDRG